jgi:hypothetical protein
VDPRVSLDVSEKRKFSCPCQESNPTLPRIQFKHYTDYAMTVPELKRLVELKLGKTVKLSTFPGMGRWEIVLFHMATLQPTTKYS